MSGPMPRAVVITRPTEYQALLDRHATVGQARFFLESRGQSLDAVSERHARFESALQQVMSAIPKSWRAARLARQDLDRFLFEPEDLVLVLGQDGLVANTAKYLSGQLVIGLNPDPERFDGVLVTHPPQATGDLLALATEGGGTIEQRTMVEAVVDDGRRLRALNELFVGHRTHQSARYSLQFGDRQELQSSSGLIVASGTGSSGWARSINRERGESLALPEPTETRLAFFVREAFPSRATGVELTEGLLEQTDQLAVTSRMDTGGVVFGDGIEQDRLLLAWGQTVRIGIASQCLRLLR